MLHDGEGKPLFKASTLVFFLSLRGSRSSKLRLVDHFSSNKLAAISALSTESNPSTSPSSRSPPLKDLDTSPRIRERRDLVLPTALACAFELSTESKFQLMDLKCLLPLCGMIPLLSLVLSLSPSTIDSPSCSSCVTPWRKTTSPLRFKYKWKSGSTPLTLTRTFTFSFSFQSMWNFPNLTYQGEDLKLPSFC
ncbi:hypothetical protein V8G54_035981 [Vigna mungo]|uniref:Uncharacterized protein n=1 Tax=Vigna mungo TaxID=3915 RepID=A0AAQ3MGA4_VIGMU